MNGLPLYGYYLACGVFGFLLPVKWPWYVKAPLIVAFAFSAYFILREVLR